MAIGDDAVAAGMDLVLGSALANTLDTEVNKTRDYIAQRTSAVVPIAKGGTGSTTAPAARTALGITPDNIGAPNTSAVGLKFTSPQFDRLSFEIPGLAFPHTLAHLTDIPPAPDLSGYVARSGSVMYGDLGLDGCNLFVPASFAASSSYTVAYINGDGRLSRAPSARRYKKGIRNARAIEGGLFIKPLREFTLKADPDAKVHLGYVAEELVGTPLERFVVRVNGEVESIDFIELLLAQCAELHLRLKLLEEGR